jgi:hypothetical protein
MCEESPPVLKHAIWVHFSAGSYSEKIFCTRCSIGTIDDSRAHIGKHEPCLMAVGLTERDIEEGKRTASVEIIVPCKYVTYVGLGPHIQVTFGSIESHLIVMGSYPSPPDAMDQSKIELALREFSDE